MGDFFPLAFLAGHAIQQAGKHSQTILSLLNSDSDYPTTLSYSKNQQVLIAQTCFIGNNNFS